MNSLKYISGLNNVIVFLFLKNHIFRSVNQIACGIELKGTLTLCIVNTPYQVNLNHY